MQFCSLSSGSRGNCTLVQSGSTRVLLDCGLSAAQVEKRLCLIGVEPESISAILVTHEHRDHIHGIEVWSKRHKVAVYANRGARSWLKGARGVIEFSTGTPFPVGDFNVLSFSTVHDAADPVGFRLEADGAVFVQATDFGRVTDSVKLALRGCNAVLIESNHDEDMLKACRYPWPLKQRILSDKGHLSNAACGELLSGIVHQELVNIVLGHISENSNTPELARETVRRQLPAHLAGGLFCASRYVPSPVFTVGEHAVSLGG